MLPLIQCHNLHHAIGTKILFAGIDFTIREGDKIGLVGYNGCGKTTLLSILGGGLEPDQGDFSRSQHLRLAVVEQFIDQRLLELNLLDALAAELPDDERDYKLYLAQQLLTELGFSPAEYEHRVKDLSGGQQNRLMFARALITEPNLILFDEPSNHLDLKTLLLFEARLKSMKIAFLLISHDRAFLDAVTQHTIFLRDKTLHHFNLPYSQAKDKLAEQDAAAVERLKVEEKNIKRLSESAKRLALWGKVYDNEKFAAKAKTMEKRIDKLKENKTFVSRGSDLNLSLEVTSSKANRMMQIEDYQVLSPSNTALFHIEDFLIRPGDRIALLGHNGAGKTTLINTIMTAYKQEKESDIVSFNPQCEIGYYDQELSALSGDLDLMQTLRKHCLSCGEKQLQSALIKAGFPHRELDKKIGILSGGERARIMFLIIKLNQPNFLILDEPTNHIDIQGKEQLEAQILEASATVLITSHDRHFVDKVADRYVLIQDGELRLIDDPEDFYAQSLAQWTHDSASGADTSSTQNHLTDETNLTDDKDEESILDRLLTLEQLLEDDKNRKSKFQKPARQAEWQTELDQLNLRLADF